MLPGRQHGRVTGGDLGIGQALPGAEADLTQARLDRDRAGMAAGDGPGGDQGALQIAGKNSPDRLTGQALGQGGCLALPNRVERHVVLALEALGGVPIRQPVADEQKPGHRVTQKTSKTAVSTSSHSAP